jgi:shikimate kinase
VEKLSERLDRPIVLVGLMGAGKSTVGKRLAKRLGLPFVEHAIPPIEDRRRLHAPLGSLPRRFARKGLPRWASAGCVARLVDGSRSA